MKISPDQTIYWQYGFLTINATLVWTWVLMIVLVIAARLITRNLKTGTRITQWQCILEMLVLGIKKQIEEIGLKDSVHYINFLGTLFVFIAFANLCIIFPGYVPPTSSLSTTAAVALSVFLAVPFYGISKKGLKGYLRSYLQPTFIMLPFNIISELSRTLALAVRLFGNIMSGVVIASILLSITPFIFPIVMNALGLLTGLVQAYIISVLATVYIAAATSDSEKKNFFKKKNLKTQKI